MARPRFDRLSPERQRAILAAAEAEFGAHGYQGASLNRIIAAAGLSKGVFYYYFDDKADLATTVFERAARAAIGPVELSLPEGEFDFWASFEDVLRGTVENLRAAPRQTDALSRLGTAIIRDSHLSQRLQQSMREWMRAATKFWRRGQEVGAVRNDLPAEVLVVLLQGIKEALARVFLPADRAPSRREMDRFIDLQLDSFRRVASPSRPQATLKRRRAGSMTRPSRQEARP